MLDYQNSNSDAEKYQIISSESLQLINSPVVQLLINAMYFIINPKDNIHLLGLISIYNSLFYPDRDLQYNDFNSINKIEELELLPVEFLTLMPDTAQGSPVAAQLLSSRTV